MMKTFRAAGLAVAFALAPLAAKAITLSDSNSVVAGTTVEMTEDRAWHWDANFYDQEGPATYVFNFHNAGTTARSMDFVFNVRQLSALFTGGVKITFDGLVWNIGQGIRQRGGQTDETNYLTFAPDETKTLSIVWGKVVGPALDAATNINFDAISPSQYAPVEPPVAPVPVPAAGLMLVAALGGLGLMRRRKA